MMILLGEDIMVLKEDGSGLLIWNTKTGGTLTALQGVENGADWQNCRIKFSSRKVLSLLPCYTPLRISIRSLWAVTAVIYSYGTLEPGTASSLP
jgi:hypothetical protein